ncbi:hypothetical protein D3C81_1840810 [compost metagenome]
MFIDTIGINPLAVDVLAAFLAIVKRGARYDEFNKNNLAYQQYVSRNWMLLRMLKRGGNMEK